MIPPEVWCEVFAFFDRQFIENELRLVCRRFSLIISRYFARTPPYRVFHNVVLTENGRLLFDVFGQIGWRSRDELKGNGISACEFNHKYMSTFPLYLRTRRAELLAKSLVPFAEHMDEVLGALQCMWDGFGYATVLIGCNDNPELYRKYLKFATAPALEISVSGGWKNDVYGSLFATPAIRECALLRLFDMPQAGWGMEAAEAVDWLFSNPKRPYLGAAYGGKDDDICRRREIQFHSLCFAFQTELTFTSHMSSALERKLDKDSSKYARKRFGRMLWQCEEMKNKNSDEIILVRCRRHACSFSRYAPSITSYN